MTRYAVSGSQPAGAYCPGIVAEGCFVYVSGQKPLRDGMIMGDSVEEQTRAALDNLAAVLARAGARLSDVVRCGVFLANIDDFQAMDRVYAEFFIEPLPARTTVGATLPGSLVEIDCVALLPGLAAV